MSIIDYVLAVLAPYECLGCSAEGSPLCVSCRHRLPPLPGRCYSCLTPSPGALTCAGCLSRADLHRVLARTAYAGKAKELVSGLKFSGTRMAAKIMAECMVPLLPDDTCRTMIVPVPTATSRARSRGYDQAKLLARELSRRTRLPYLDCLARGGHTRQVGMSRRQRLSQMEGAFRASEVIRGKDLLLIDDVVTTGATLEAAASSLRTSGAGRIGAMVFCAA